MQDLPSGSQVKITGFVVHYKKLSSALKPAQLTFTPRINAAVVGKETALNGANNPNGRELTYKIAGLADTDYSIEKTEAGINVTVNKTGSYTLRAESLEDGELIFTWEPLVLFINKVTSFASPFQERESLS